MKTIINNVVIVALTADLLALTTDTTISWTSPSLPRLISTDPSINPLGYVASADEISWIGSLLSIGAVCGPLPCCYLADKIGRKITLLLIALPFIASYVILAFPQGIYSFYIARIFGGMGMGAACTLLPMYLTEISEDSNRGTLLSSLNVFWCFGSLVPYLLGPYTEYILFNFLMAAFPMMFLVLFLFLAPETPYYLMRNNRLQEAETSLVRLRTNKTQDEIAKELAHIKDVLDHEQKGTIADLYSSKINLKAVGISLVLIIFQQLSGINAMMSYTQLIFEMASPTEAAIPSHLSSLIVGTVFFVSSFLIIFIADRVDRKVLMITSSLGISISMAVFGFYFFMKSNTEIDVQPLNWIPISCLMGFMITFNIGMGILPWSISSELFSMEIRSIGATLVSVFCSLTSFFVLKFFVILNDLLGEDFTFWIFSASGFACAVFTYFFVPETRGKSFKEIQTMLK